MAKLIRSFVKGIMNKDLDERLLPKGEFRDAQNVSIGTSEGSDVGAVENTKGNTNVSDLGPAGSGTLTVNAVCVGATPYEEEFKIYWFVRDGVTSYIFEYDELNDATATVVSDNRAVGTNMLNFQSDYLITGANYFDGYLYWTDNYNQPRQLNIGRAKGFTTLYGNAWSTRPVNEGGPLSGDDIDVIVKPPEYGPYITMTNNGTQENNISERFLEFAYRWKYTDNRYSALSPFSATAFQCGEYQYDYVESINSAMVNDFNEVTIKYEAGVPQVEEIQIVFRDTKSLNISIVENVNKNNLANAQTPPAIISNTTQTLIFDNSKIYSVLAAEQLGRLFDNVPLKAQAQEMIGRRLVYGNYLEFRDLISMGENINLRYTLELVSNTATAAAPLRTFRSDRDYQIGIAYLDEYQRQTTVLTPATISTGLLSNNTIYIPPDNSITGNDIQIKIDSYAPDWATHYRLYIKQKKDEYYNVFPLQYYEDGAYRWFKFQKADVDKFDIGGYLICKANALGPTLSNKQYKVLDVGVKEKNFLNNNEPGGLYFKLGVTAGEFLVADLTKIKSYSYGIFALNKKWPPYPLFNRHACANGLANPNTIFWHWQNVNNPIPYLKISSNQNFLSIVYPNASPQSKSFKGKQDKRLSIVIGQPTASGEETFTVTDFVTGTLTPTAIEITGSAQTIPGLGNGYQITFHQATGHTIGDRWVINIRSYRDDMSWGGTGMGGGTWYGATWQEGAKTQTDALTRGGWAIIPNDSFVEKGASADAHDEDATDKQIQAGATVTFNYIKELNQGSGSGHIETPYQTYESSRAYANIEEWFWEDGIYNKFEHFDQNSVDRGYENVFFRRGFNWDKTDVWTSVETKTIDSQAYPPVRMLIKGYGAHKGRQRARIWVEMEIVQPESPIFFETVPKDNDVDIYHELYSTDSFTCIKAGTGENLHQGNIQSQAIGGTAIVSLNDLYPPTSPTQLSNNTTFNAFCWGNGLESNRIKDDFNAPIIKFSPRVSTIIEDYKQERKGDSLTYSATYGHLINGFNDFNLSLGNWKDLDISFGSVQKLYARDTNILVLQQDKISKVLYGKNLLSDASGGGQITSMPEVLGTQVSFPGEYGISDNPESFAQWGPDVYFSDERRGCILSLEGDVLQEISSNGMRDYFKDLLAANPREVKLGAVDPYSQKYNLAARDLALPCSFRVQAKGLEYEGTWIENGENFYVGGGASTYCFFIYADGAWTAAAVNNGSGTAFVTSVSPASGSGNDVVCVTLTSTVSNRGFILRFTSCGTTFDVNIFQRSVPDRISIGTVVVSNPQDSGLLAGPSYDYSGYTGAGDVSVGTYIPPRGTVGAWGGSSGWPPNDGIPEEGDTVTMLGPAEVTTAPNKGFEGGLNNTMSYLVTTTAYSRDQISTLTGLATTASATYDAPNERYEANFTYNNPSNDSFLYIIWDYTDSIELGGSGNSLGQLGTNHVELDYGSDVGNATLNYDANDTPNRFVLKYNGAIVADSGYVGLNSLANYDALIAADVPDSEISLSSPYDGTVNNGSGTFNFKKYSAAITKGELIVYSKLTPSDGWDAGITVPSLTSFTISTTPQATETDVCADTAATTYYHDGSGASPIVGDAIYSDSAGASVLVGGNAYFATGAAGPSNTWVVVNSLGVVAQVGSCACAEVAIPVIATTALELIEGNGANYTLQATNNPTSWQIITSCYNYVLYGGSTGAVFSGTHCLASEAKVVTVRAGETQEECFERLSVSQLSGAADATYTLSRVCSELLLPEGVQIGEDGSISGTPTLAGEYCVVVRATNCFGDSTDTEITISVEPEGLFKFSMDGTNPQDTSSAACALTAIYDYFFSDGEFAYPILNDRVYTYTDSLSDLRALEDPTVIESSSGHYYVAFNGEQKWYLMDNNKAIKIARDGTVVDTYDCTAGLVKTTEAGAGGFDPDTDKTTEGGSDKTLE